MKGKLNQEDWRPLLTSSITYHYIIYQNPTKGGLVRVILPNTVAVLLMTYFLLQIFKLQDKTYAQQLLFALIFGYVVFAAILVSSWINWYSRSLVFAFDRRGGDLVGRDVLLLALMKYRDAVSSLIGGLMHRGFRPSLGRRIRKLQRN